MKKKLWIGFAVIAPALLMQLGSKFTHFISAPAPAFAVPIDAVIVNDDAEVKRREINNYLREQEKQKTKPIQLEKL